MSAGLGSLAAFAALGLLGSGHCVAMCGPLALAAARQSQPWTMTCARHVAYQAGKTSTYVALALLARALGLGWLRSDWYALAQHILAALTGATMVALGVQWATGWRWRPPRWATSRPGCGVFAALAGSRSVVATFALGWLNGFLPCGLLWVALAYATIQPTWTRTAAGAAVFGFATLPGLLALALVRRAPALRARVWLHRAAGVALLTFGLLTCVRGVPAVHHWAHDHLLAGSDFITRHFPLLHDGSLPEWCRPEPQSKPQ